MFPDELLWKFQTFWINFSKIFENSLKLLQKFSALVLWLCENFHFCYRNLHCRPWIESTNVQVYVGSVPIFVLATGLVLTPTNCTFLPKQWPFQNKFSIFRPFGFVRARRKRQPANSNTNAKTGLCGQEQTGTNRFTNATGDQFSCRIYKRDQRQRSSDQPQPTSNQFFMLSPPFLKLKIRVMCHRCCLTTPW